MSPIAQDIIMSILCGASLTAVMIYIFHIYNICDSELDKDQYKFTKIFVVMLFALYSIGCFAFIEIINFFIK